MKTTDRFKIVLLVMFGISLTASGQTYDLIKVLKENKSSAVARNASALNEGKYNAVRIDENSGEGLLWIDGVNFSSGSIEVDLRGKDVLQRSFVGIAFHGVNDSTYDAIYFRPFNFHSKDSIRKIHAVQYISHPEFGWKKLREEKNGIYEKAVTPAPDANGWFHAKIEVKNGEVVVYVDGAKKPSLSIKKLNERKSGKIALWVGDSSGGDFANLKITPR